MNTNLPQRARYYHALLANHMLAVGEDYPNLKDSYVIFLCNFDHNGYGHAFTHYQAFSSRSLAGSLGDGSHTIVLNAKGNWDEVNDELKGIFQLVLHQQPTLGHLGPEIASEIKYTKQTKLGGRKYMELAGTF